MLKKIKAILSGSTFYAEDNNGGYATIQKMDTDIDASGNVYGGNIVMSYGRQGMPSHTSLPDVAENDIEATMRAHQPDMRKWTETGYC